MVDYTNIRGLRVKYLSADPTNSENGEIWYNSTSGTLKSAGMLSKAWASSAAKSNQTSSSVSGIQTAALSAFGYDYGGPDTWSDTCEEWNGSSWTAGGTANRARYQTSQTGTSTATIAAFGVSRPLSPPHVTNIQSWAEEFNGTGWTNLTDAPQAMAGGVGEVGTTTAFLSGGGNDNNSGEPGNYVSEWNGASWSVGTSLPSDRGALGATGSQTDALFYGGSDAAVGEGITNTESYNGTSWTALNAMNTALWSRSSIGTQDAALASGGDPGNAEIEEWDGTSWTVLPQTSIVPGGMAACGTTTAALAQAVGPSVDKKNCYEWNVSKTTQTLTTS